MRILLPSVAQLCNCIPGYTTVEAQLADSVCVCVCVCVCVGVGSTAILPKYISQNWCLFSSCLQVICRLDGCSKYEKTFSNMKARMGGQREKPKWGTFSWA